MNDIKKYVQDFFQDGTVTIIGSGLSIAEGLSSMNNLADELKRSMTSSLKKVEDKEKWRQINEQFNKGIGLEQALYNFERIAKEENMEFP